MVRTSAMKSHVGMGLYLMIAKLPSSYPRHYGAFRAIFFFCLFIFLFHIALLAFSLMLLNLHENR